VAEDNGGSPLPRRVPGTKRGPGTEPLARPALSDSDLQRIRAALDSAQAQAPAEAPPAERPAPLPRRAPDAGNGGGPPAPTARPGLPASLLPTRPKKAPASTEPPPAVHAPRPGGEKGETRRKPDVTGQPGPATAKAADPQLIPAQRTPAEEQADRKRETAGREEETAGQKNGQGSLETPPKFTPPKSVSPRPASPTAPASPPLPARLRKRGRGRAIITGSAIVTLVLLSAGSALLLTRHAGPARARTDASTEGAVRNDAAAWVASQVSRAGLVSCGQEMCQALQAHGVPAADLLVLKPGASDPRRSAVIVVTPAVTKMVGARLLAADAPATIASFGSGARRISVRLIYPRGAAAFFAALRREIADRKAAGTSFLQLDPRLTQSAAVRQELRSGQVDARLLLTLGEVASQWPISVVAFGDRGPGATRGISLRSADLTVTSGRAGPKLVGLVQMMSGFVHGLGEYFADAQIQMVRLANGQDVVRIAFTAPGRFGLLRTAP
jgi:hypothetical protein